MRRRLDPEIRRKELLDAAERVLRRRGAGQTRIEDVTRAARASKGTFYVYFDSWEDLLLALRRRVFEAFDARFAMAKPPASRADWLRLLDDLSVGFVDFVLSLEGLHAAIVHGELADEPPSDPSVDADARIAAFLEAGAAAGVFERLDTEASAGLIFALLHAGVDAITQGRNRERVLAAQRELLHRILLPSECGGG